MGALQLLCAEVLLLCVIRDILKKSYDFLKSILFSDAKPVFTGGFNSALVATVVECLLQAFDDARVVVLTHYLIREDIVIYASIQHFAVYMVNKIANIENILESGGERSEL